MIGLTLLLYVAGGGAIGGLYFGSLWWNAQLFGRVGHLRTLLASMALRFAFLGTTLFFVSLAGALPLLAAALGLMLARAAVLRRVRVMAP